MIGSEGRTTLQAYTPHHKFLAVPLIRQKNTDRQYCIVLIADLYVQFGNC